MMDTECQFTARIRNVRYLATLIKSVHFKDIATCRISAEGISFVLEESRCLFGRCLMQRTVFEDYKYEPPLFNDANDLQSGSQSESQRSQRRLPQGYEADGSVTFGINLSTLLSCLNMFGTANVSSVGGDGTGGGGNSGSGSSGFGSGGTSVTAIKLSYSGFGSKLYLTLEDDGIVTTCGVPTFDPEPPVDFDFNDELQSKIIMKSQWLEEGLRDLDATSDRVVVRLSPDIPHLRISSLGTIENLDVNYSQGDVIETFIYHYDRPIEASYSFSHVLHVLRACQVANKVNIMVDDKDFMKIQFLLPVADHKYLFAEYSFTPLEIMD